jgi:hypothetical protein
VCFDVYFLPKDTHPNERPSTKLAAEFNAMVDSRDAALSKVRAATQPAAGVRLFWALSRGAWLRPGAPARAGRLGRLARGSG